MMKTNDNPKVLAQFQSDLSTFLNGAREVFYNQSDRIQEAYQLDEEIRTTAKILIDQVNSRNFTEASKTRGELLEAVRLMLEYRGTLSRSSYLYFRSIKEAIEALFYFEFALRIYEPTYSRSELNPQSMISGVIDLKFQVTRRGRTNEIFPFREDEFKATSIMALLESVGEITKGIEEFLMNTETPTEVRLEVCSRAHALAQIVLKSLSPIISQSSRHIDKFSRRLLHIMNRCTVNLGMKINELKRELKNDELQKDIKELKQLLSQKAS